MTIDTRVARRTIDLRRPWGYAEESLSFLDEIDSLRARERALIDELTEARRERDEARRALGVEKANIDTLVTSCETLTAKLAHARAATLEEAAQLTRDHFELVREPLSLVNGLLALSATPATVVCVPVETVRAAVVGMTQVRDCIEGGWDPHKGSPLGRAKWADAMRNVRAALAEMAKVTP